MQCGTGHVFTAQRSAEPIRVLLMPLQQLDGQPGSSTAIQLATQCLELALSGCIKIKSETKEGRKGRRSPMQADGWRDGSTRAVGAALYVQLHSSCSLPQALAAAAACRMRPHKPSRAAAHCRSSMTTAWQAMERFSPSESTFSCVLALMFTTLRATRGRGASNGASAVQSNRFLIPPLGSTALFQRSPRCGEVWYGRAQQASLPEQLPQVPRVLCILHRAHLGCAPSIWHRLSRIASLCGDILGRCSRENQVRTAGAFSAARCQQQQGQATENAS